MVRMQILICCKYSGNVHHGQNRLNEYLEHL